MAKTGLTKVRSMGPIAAAVQHAGGSLTRLLKKAELPAGLMERPELLIPLRDQLRFLELAVRETDDDALPARLSFRGGVEHLGAFGQHVCRAPTLEAAISRCNGFMQTLLQSATRLSLTTLGPVAKWTYIVTDHMPMGRQQNELLALGYMLDLLRRYFGVGASAIHAELSGSRAAAQGAVEQLFGIDIAPGPLAALVFPAKYLEAPNQTPQAREAPEVSGETPLPEPSNLTANVECMIALGLLERRPHEDWLCRRLGMSRRSLQRNLARQNTSFRQVLGRELLAEAAKRLASPQTSITQIALDLGYSDCAHFTRAFVRHFAESPQAWRCRMQYFAGIREPRS